MSEAYCLWPDKELVNAAEWQQEQCEEAEQALKKMESEG